MSLSPTLIVIHCPQPCSTRAGCRSNLTFSFPSWPEVITRAVSCLEIRPSWILSLCDTHSLGFFSSFPGTDCFYFFHSINGDSFMNTLHLNPSGYRNKSENRVFCLFPSSPGSRHPSKCKRQSVSNS